MKKKKNKIAIIGGGYIGLPLAIECGKYFKTILVDKDSERVKNIKRNIDYNYSVSRKDFLNSKKLKSYTNLEKIFFLFCHHLHKVLILNISQLLV